MTIISIFSFLRDVREYIFSVFETNYYCIIFRWFTILLNVVSSFKSQSPTVHHKLFRSDPSFFYCVSVNLYGKLLVSIYMRDVFLNISCTIILFVMNYLLMNSEIYFHGKIFSRTYLRDLCRQWFCIMSWNTRNFDLFYIYISILVCCIICYLWQCIWTIWETCYKWRVFLV